MTVFVQRLLASCEARRSLLCVGLDPDPSLMAIPDIGEFNRAIVDATKDLVCAYKPNLPFYEAHGSRGIVALEETVAHIRSQAPGVIVLGDAKRGDIGSTNVHYARALFDAWDFDAATVNWYAGGEAMEPLLERADRGIFVWCRSSNEGAAELQDLQVSSDGAPRRLFERVAEGALARNQRGNVGLVVGATYPDDLGTVRSICPQMPVLVPGVGAQGGALRASVAAGIDSFGRNLVVSSSRGILYASRDRARFQEAARGAAEELRDKINQALEEEGKGWRAT